MITPPSGYYPGDELHLRRGNFLITLLPELAPLANDTARSPKPCPFVMWAVNDLYMTIDFISDEAPTLACAEWCGLTTASAIQLGLVDPAKFGAGSPVDEDDDDLDGVVYCG